eukprot:jgi/Picsp_1/5167/NSC_02530-R1_hypothetical protein CHLNCDRAFT_57525 [Chlorella variabilis]
MAGKMREENRIYRPGIMAGSRRPGATRLFGGSLRAGRRWLHFCSFLFLGGMLVVLTGSIYGTIGRNIDIDRNHFVINGRYGIRGVHTGNLILAAAANTSAEGVAAFVKSLAEHMPQNRIVLFADTGVTSSANLVAMCKEYEVHVVPLTWPELVDGEEEGDSPKPGRLALHKMRHMLKYLEKGIDGNVRGVLLALNSGDTVFQGDPFRDVSVTQNIPRDGVVLATEGGPQLGRVTVNVTLPMWDAIGDCFGSSMVKRMGRLPVINGDVLIGSRIGVMQLLLLVVDVLATRTREKCLQHPRADLAAIQYAVGEFGRDPNNVDFPFSLRDHVTSTVFGVRYGLPAKIDARGILRRSIPVGGKRRGPTPTVITQYSYNQYLREMYSNRYKMYNQEVELEQKSGYVGEQNDQESLTKN